MKPVNFIWSALGLLGLAFSYVPTKWCIAKGCRADGWHFFWDFSGGQVVDGSRLLLQIILVLLGLAALWFYQNTTPAPSKTPEPHRLVEAPAVEKQLPNTSLRYGPERYFSYGLKQRKDTVGRPTWVNVLNRLWDYIFACCLFLGMIFLVLAGLIAMLFLINFYFELGLFD